MRGSNKVEILFDADSDALFIQNEKKPEWINLTFKHAKTWLLLKKRQRVEKSKGEGDFACDQAEC